MSRKSTPSPAVQVPSVSVAAFDFDGTLTWKDSFTAFLMATCGAPQVTAAFALQPSLGINYLRTRDRGTLKSQLLYHLLGPIPQGELETLINVFVARTGMSLFRPDALDAWRGHEADGVQRVIVTASPDLLVRPFGALIGADRVIGTRLGFSDNGRLRPDLDGANCRCDEKVRRLHDAYGDTFDLQAAYGDTRGDKEMLAAARQGHYRLFKARPK